MIELPTAIEALGPFTLHVAPRREWLFGALAPGGGYSLGLLHVRRHKMDEIAHRRGFSPAEAGCGMYGLDFVAPIGSIDKRPGGISGHST